MKHLRLKIPNEDRVGLVLDISQELVRRQINIVSMEVELNTIFLELDLKDNDKRAVVEALKKIPQVTDVVEISLMPHQERAEQVRTVLASVGDGIIAINHLAQITQYNPAAEKIIRLPYKNVIGKELTQVFPADTPLLQSLKNGAVYNNREIMLERTKSHYLASGRPIIDASGKIIGAVAILKDISDVRELVYTVTGQPTLTFDEIIHKSAIMQRTVAMAKTFARSDSTVLIRGETGTGKELFARAIHAASPRAGKMFVPINCSAIPDTLLESELFGYEDGAFTGAVKGGKQGLFEFAKDGTIFLDEIAEMPSHLQAKLLRVLQDGKVRRIGGTREVSVSVRIVGATNRSLEEMVADGRFREDLYYRLNVIPLYIPPLRERREDIPLLAEFLLQRFAARLSKNVTAISETAMEKLLQHHWPGNVREFENVIERAVNIVGGSIVLAEHIIIDNNCQAAVAYKPSGQQTLDELLNHFECEILQNALKKYGTSRQMGTALGLSHTAILKKLRKYGLKLTKNHKKE